MLIGNQIKINKLPHEFGLTQTPKKNDPYGNSSGENIKRENATMFTVKADTQQFTDLSLLFTGCRAEINPALFLLGLIALKEKKHKPKDDRFADYKIMIGNREYQAFLPTILEELDPLNTIVKSLHFISKQFNPKKKKTKERQDIQSLTLLSLHSLNLELLKEMNQLILAIDSLIKALSQLELTQVNLEQLKAKIERLRTLASSPEELLKKFIATNEKHQEEKAYAHIARALENAKEKLKKNGFFGTVNNLNTQLQQLNLLFDSFSAALNKLPQESFPLISLAAVDKIRKPLETVETFSQKLYPGQGIQVLKESPVFRSGRYDETFFPVHLGEDHSLYLSMEPLSESVTKIEDSFYSTYVIPVCLLGSSLRGKGMDGWFDVSAPFVKHDVPFGKTNIKILEVEYTEGFNLYEFALFSTLQRLKLFIQKTSSAHEKRTVFIHLPSYDYMLFGVETFLHGRITADALKNFFKIIIEKTERYKKEINKIFPATQNFIVEFVTPFETIFGQDAFRRKNPDDIFSQVFRTLNLQEILSLKDDQVDIDYMDTDEPKKCKENERHIVHLCIKKLISEESTNPTHLEIWRNFIEKADKCETLPDLFALANAAVLSIAGKGKAGLVCSLLESSERQIQRTHQKLRNGDETVVYTRYLEHVMTYTDRQNVDGQVFYCGHDVAGPKDTTIREFLNHNGALGRAITNMGLFPTPRQGDADAAGAKAALTLGKFLEEVAAKKKHDHGTPPTSPRRGQPATAQPHRPHSSPPMRSDAPAGGAEIGEDSSFHL